MHSGTCSLLCSLAGFHFFEPAFQFAEPFAHFREASGAGLHSKLLAVRAGRGTGDH
jgi:hypothetical protein